LLNQLKLKRKIVELETENRQLKSALQQSEERFFKIFHAASNPMAITTVKEGRIIDLNEADARLGGFTREELIGHTIAERNLLVDPNQREVLRRKLQEEGRVHNLEVEVRTKTGDIRTVLLSLDPITVNDEPCELGFTIDITERKKESDALRQSEEKYRALVENSLQGLAIFQDSHFVFCNNAFAAMSGYSVGELLALSPGAIFEMIHIDDRALVRDRIRDRMEGKQPPQRYEHLAFKKDGTEVWLELFSSPAEYDGRPAIQVVFMDITERKKAEQALRESEERFRLIAETIDEVFWIFDMEKEVVTYLSPAYDQILGFPREYLFENQEFLLDLIHPDDRNQVISAVERMRAGQLIDCEYRLFHFDGSIRHIWNRGFPVPTETGRIKRYIGVGQDVTAWRRAEEAIKQSREYLNQLINRIGDPIFAIDRDHRFVLVNDAMCTFAGWKREELLGKTIRQLRLPKEEADSIWKQESLIFESGQDSVVEEEATDAQGNTHTIISTKTLLTDSAGNLQIVAIMRDITERKRLEAQFLQAQKMEAIGTLAGGVAHDFNNLLTVIKGYTELLLEEIAPDDPRCFYLQQIQKAGQQAASLISQLLAFSRKQILHPEILDLNRSVEEMSTMLRRVIREDIELVAIARPGLGLISADPAQIQQIVMNLAVNARDAMPQGGRLTIETANVEFDEEYVRAHPMVKPGPYVMLAISDNGIGMDAATQARIFEPFFTTKGQGKGTGLGLSTVYGIVKQSNGFIWAYSEPGKGTTFKTYFPRVEGEVTESTAERRFEPEFQGSETILLVEDEESVRTLAGRILREQGYDVLEAGSGTEALDIARKHGGEIHVVVTDVIMPGMSGKDLVSQLKIARPGIKSLYISGYPDDAIAHHGILDSGVTFLQKPFTVESLTRKIREVMH
jgi:two-component system cell cycle sensor histidine kinase/response regulator CckA